ncbi:MAG: cupin domain-containing protein [Planctomycetota bacterium]|nr:cupin domain-containing protein [Planctomycetota bacterium]
MDAVSLRVCEAFTTKDGSIIRELLSHRNSSIKNQSLAEATIGPGIKTEAHFHKASEEIYYIIAGSGMMCFEDEVRRVVEGDAISIPPGMVHWIHNDGTVELKLLCCCAPAYEHDDTFMVDDSEIFSIAKTGPASSLGEPVNAYSKHVSSPRSISDLVNAYERCVLELSQAVEGLTTDELKARPIPGKWSTLEVVCHLADTDIYFTDRIERTLALDNPLLMGVDERPYPDKLQFQEQFIEEELELMTILRRRTARILRRQPDAVWDRTGVHSTAGVVTLRDLVEKAIGHVLHHLPFIAEKRVALVSARVQPKSSKPPQEYLATIEWKNLGPDFIAGKYSREHRWTFDGGVSFAASPSPHVVPSPWSVEAAVDPEEALVAAASSCHMLTFLWLASKKGLVVDSYIDNAAGTMTKNEQRVSWVSQIKLRPKIGWSGANHPDQATIAELHHVAHSQCFIAQSIKSRIVID